MFRACVYKQHQHQRLTELLDLADELVLGGVDVDVGERGVRVRLPEARHGLLEPEVEELRDLVVGDGAAVAVRWSGEVGAVQQRVGQAAERPCVVDPEVPSSTRVDTLQICTDIYSDNEQTIHVTVCATSFKEQLDALLSKSTWIIDVSLSIRSGIVASTCSVVLLTK